MWQALPSKWNAKAAEDLYRGPIISALKKELGPKRRYVLLEDNDPAGYKSNKGRAAKADLHIEPLRFPKYSPDLNPLDFYVWSEIERRMLAKPSAKLESGTAYKARLRRVAKALPASGILKALASIPKRAKAIVEAKGGHVALD